jgi:uncharacterized protein YcbK (DUF882 family)
MRPFEQRVTFWKKLKVKSLHTKCAAFDISKAKISIIATIRILEVMSDTGFLFSH